MTCVLKEAYLGTCRKFFEKFDKKNITLGKFKNQNFQNRKEKSQKFGFVVRTLLTLKSKNNFEYGYDFL